MIYLYNINIILICKLYLIQSELHSILKKNKDNVLPKTKIPLDPNRNYADLWFDNQEDLDSFDSLMRKKIYFQNAFGEKGDKDFIINGTKASFGIFTKGFQERVFKNSEKLDRQLKYVSSITYNNIYYIIYTIINDNRLKMLKILMLTKVLAT